MYCKYIWSSKKTLIHFLGSENDKMLKILLISIHRNSHVVLSFTYIHIYNCKMIIIYAGFIYIIGRNRADLEKLRAMIGVQVIILRCLMFISIAIG